MSPILTGVIASGITGQLNTWSPDGAFDSIASVTLSSGVTSVEFIGIPSGYKHLQIRALSKVDSGTPDMHMTFNGDNTGTGYYKFHILRGDGSGTAATSEAYTAPSVWNPVAGSWQASITDIPDYPSRVKNKVSKTLVGRDSNGSGGEVGFWTHLWQNTNGITSIKFFPNTGVNISQYSTFALYGVK